MNFINTNTLLFLSIIIISCSPKSEEIKDETAINLLEISSPESLGFSTDSLAKIDVMIKGYIEKGFIPNGVLLIARHGKIAYERAIGWSNIEAQTPVRMDNKFRLASMTKPITSAAILQLYEQGKLDVQDPVSKFIPEFANPKVLISFNESDTTWESKPAQREITLHHLLTHTSGTPYGFLSPNLYSAIYAKAGVPDGANYFNITLEEKMAALGKLPILFDPGEKWFYGLATDILGRVVEVASGQKLDDYISNNITKPLGMDDTDFFFSDSINHNLVSVYRPLGDTAITEMKHYEGVVNSPDFPFRGAKKYLSGGSGLSGTARDYFVFCQTILNGGKLNNMRILNDTTVSLMMTNQMDTVSYPWGGGKFGYGYHIVMENGEDARLQRKGNASWAGIYNTTFWIDPSRDVVAILLSQVVFNPNREKIYADFEALVNNALVDETL